MSATLTIPETQKAAIVQKDKSVAIQIVPVAKPGPSEVLVQITVAAQNPTDWKSIDWGRIQPGQSPGCDFAGRVVALGEGVTAVKIGERVAGWNVSGGGAKQRSSAFREYTVVPWHHLTKIPANTSDEEAATIPLAAATAVLGLRYLSNFPQPAPLNKWFLVWGGASSVGLYAVQLAHIQGYKVVTTASAKNHELVKSHGADVAVDYHASDVVEQIVRATGQGGVDHAYDAISEGNSTALAIKALKQLGARNVAIVLPVKDTDPTADVYMVLCSGLLGYPIDAFGMYIPRDERVYQFGLEFTKLVSEWLQEGRFKGNPHTLMSGGLNAIPGGLAFMKEGKVSGTKLVYRIAETKA
ncbi:hypothetical protein EWM64_g5689 [Hericium alpestre]|uniref:Enoyl reductase (ER) domain-containing protein n=1 Tax=Hericium alpestre TaxID=135208 RepID=A0A4Y9ZVV3_9AGAM|nr:hypothetical protein EWM64_g5689 [Hericium alpestre]